MLSIIIAPLQFKDASGLEFYQLGSPNVQTQRRFVEQPVAVLGRTNDVV